MQLTICGHPPFRSHSSQSAFGAQGTAQKEGISWILFRVFRVFRRPSNLRHSCLFSSSCYFRVSQGETDCISQVIRKPCGLMNAYRTILLPVLVALAGGSMISTSMAQALPDKPVVQGKFLGDGKDGNIKFLVVQNREPFSDEAAIQFVFTEKDPSSSKKPEFDAMFKELGSALSISTFKDGRIFGCEVAHTSHEKSPFTALGQIKMTDFKVTDTHVSGHLTTGGEDEAFGQKWDVDLTFSAPLPKGAFAAVKAPEPEPEKAGKKMSKTDEPAAEPIAAGPKIAVKDLPLPAGALDVEYKQLVGHITFRSESSVSTVATDFAAKLKAQGWKDGPGSLMGKSNAILKRKLNEADLTIMVQPAGKGCNVKVFTEGLDWSSTPASSAAKPAKAGDADDIEAEANKLINDALKKIPGGL